MHSVCAGSVKTSISSLAGLQFLGIQIANDEGGYVKAALAPWFVYVCATDPGALQDQNLYVYGTLCT